MYLFQSAQCKSVSKVIILKLCDLLAEKVPNARFWVKHMIVFKMSLGISFKNFTVIFPLIPEKLNLEHNTMWKYHFRKNAIKDARCLIRHNFRNIIYLRIKNYTCSQHTIVSKKCKFLSVINNYSSYCERLRSSDKSLDRA